MKCSMVRLRSALALVYAFKNNTHHIHIHMCVDNPSPRTLHAKGIVAFGMKVYAREIQRGPHARNLSI